MPLFCSWCWRCCCCKLQAGSIWPLGKHNKISIKRGREAQTHIDQSGFDLSLSNHMICWFVDLLICCLQCLIALDCFFIVAVFSLFQCFFLFFIFSCFSILNRPLQPQMSLVDPSSSYLGQVSTGAVMNNKAFTLLTILSSSYSNQPWKILKRECWKW